MIDGGDIIIFKSGTTFVEVLLSLIDDDNTVL